jgi:hypothetical protein
MVESLADAISASRKNQDEWIREGSVSRWRGIDPSIHRHAVEQRAVDAGWVAWEVIDQR